MPLSWLKFIWVPSPSESPPATVPEGTLGNSLQSSLTSVFQVRNEKTEAHNDEEIQHHKGDKQQINISPLLFHRLSFSSCS